MELGKKEPIPVPLTQMPVTFHPSQGLSCPVHKPPCSKRNVTSTEGNVAFAESLFTFSSSYPIFFSPQDDSSSQIPVW